MAYEYHTPVLADEVLQYLNAMREGTYVDGTLGGGGHAEHILRSTSPRSTLIGFDKDADAITFASKRLAPFVAQIKLVHDNVASVRTHLEKLSVKHIDGFLMDLGVSSHQIDDASRGFSFQGEGRLDMRMNAGQSLDAAAVVNSYDQEKLAEIFAAYGEERHARKIARKIVEMRKTTSIQTTKELAEIVKTVVGTYYLQKSLARIFQAIRIEVNDELEKLRSVLHDALDILNVGGRMVIISYHSLEDRIVKEFFKAESSKNIPSHSKLLPDRSRIPQLTVLTRKPVTAGEQEILGNPRARSAKLRAAEKTGGR